MILVSSEGGKKCVFCVNDVADPSLQDSGCTDPNFPNCNAPHGEAGLTCEPECVIGPLGVDCTDDAECCPFTEGFDGANVGNCLSSGDFPDFFEPTSTCVGQSCNLDTRRKLGNPGDNEGLGFCFPPVDGTCEGADEAVCANLCNAQCECSEGRNPLTIPECEEKNAFGGSDECEGLCCGCETSCEDFCCDEPEYRAYGPRRITGRLGSLTIRQAFNMSDGEIIVVSLKKIM